MDEESHNDYIYLVEVELKDWVVCVSVNSGQTKHEDTGDNRHNVEARQAHQ